MKIHQNTQHPEEPATVAAEQIGLAVQQAVEVDIVDPYPMRMGSMGRRSVRRTSGSSSPNALEAHNSSNRLIRLLDIMISAVTVFTITLARPGSGFSRLLRKADEHHR